MSTHFEEVAHNVMSRNHKRRSLLLLVVCLQVIFMMTEAVAHSQEDRFRPLLLQGEKNFAAGEYELAKQSFSAVIDAARPIPDAKTQLATALNDLADIYRELERPKEARPLLEEALQVSEQISNPKLQLAIWNNIALVYQLQGSFRAAASAFERALSLTAKEYGRRSLTYAQILDNLGQLRTAEEKFRQAESQFRESLRIRQEHANGSEVAGSLNSIAGLYAIRGRYAQAEPLYREALAVVEKSLSPNHRRTMAAILASLGAVLKAQFRLNEAEFLLRKSLEIRRTVLPAEHPFIAATLLHLGDTLQALGKYEEAAPTLRQALTISRKVYSSNDVRIAATLETYARVLPKLNKAPEATPFLDEAGRIRAYLSYRSPSSLKRY